MIKDTELRKGNLVFSTTLGIACPVQTIEVSSIALKCDTGKVRCDYVDHKYTSIAAIPLTPEWLVDHGFECKEHRKRFFRGEEGTTMGYKISPDLILIPNFIRDASGNFDGFMLIDGRGITIGASSIYYIHQLQNLYFALTGEELTIKEPA